MHKTVQIDKKFCPSCSIFQEPYIIWLPFMSHIWKVIISPGNFFIFSKFWFFGLLGGKRAKNGLEWQKIMSVALHISGTIHVNIVQMCKIIISLSVFFNVIILIFQVVRRLKRKEWPKMLKISLSHLMFQQPNIRWCSFMVHMYV